jgi:hypothetical protein
VTGYNSFMPQYCSNYYFYPQDFYDTFIIKMVTKSELKSGDIAIFDTLPEMYQTYLLNAYMNNKIRFFSNIKKWKKSYSDINFIAGLNLGIPAIVTNGDARARESCELFNIPWHHDYGYETDIVAKYYETDFTNMNDNYNNLYDNYIKFIEEYVDLNETKQLKPPYSKPKKQFDP